MAAVVGILRVLLQADAAEFQSQFDKADKKAKQTLQGIQRLANDFSGQRLVNEAAKVTIAVNQIGGASKLTQQELSRVGAVVDAAVSKLRIMGQTVPPEIAKISAEIHRLNTEAKQSGEIDALRSRISGVGSAAASASAGGLSQLSAALGSVGIVLPALGVAGAVTGIVRLTTAAMESASRITDLSQKLGVSTDAIQEMQAVANQTGSTVETFAQAAFKLGVNVADGSDKARKAIAALGLEYDKLRAMKPEDMHRAVIAALEGVSDANERNRIGVALYGKTFSEIAPAIAAGYTQIAGAAVKAGADQIKALDDAGDAWQKFKDDVGASITNILGNIVLAAQQLGSGIKDLTPDERNLIAFTKKSGGDLSAVLADITRKHAEAKAAAEANSQATGQAAQTVTDYAQELAAARAEVAALSAAQRTQLNAALQLGGDAAQKYADSIHLSDAALRLYSGTLKGGAKDVDAFKKAQDALFGLDLIERANNYAKELGDVSNLTKVSEEKKRELKTAVDAAIAAYERLGQTAPKALRDISAATTPLLVNMARLTFVPLQQSVEDVGAALHDLASGPIAETGAATAAANRQAEEWARTNGAVLAPTIRAVGIALEDAEDRAGSFRSTVEAVFKDLPNVIMRAVEGGGNIGQAIGAKIGAELFGPDSPLTQAAQKWLSDNFGSVGKMIGDLIPGVGTLIGSKLGPKIGKWINDMFGDLFGMEGRKVNDLRDAFTAAQGGIDKLAERAAAAGLTLERFYKAKTVKEYEAAIRELEAAFDDLDRRRASAADLFDQIMEAGRTGIPAAMKPAIDSLIALGLLTDEQVKKLKKLGDGSEINVDQLLADLDLIHGRVESLGPAFQQANIDKTAAKYINSIDRMIQAGGDVGGILFDAKEEISDLVNQSIKFGTTLPANMKPWIEELIRAGLLLDEQGNKITDITKIKFGDAIETEGEKQLKVWDEILKAIQALVDEIKHGLVGAINSIPDSKRIKVSVDYDNSGDPGTGDPGFATGTMGRFGDFFANFGRGFNTRLHGWEAVVTPNQAPAFAAGVLESALANGGSSVTNTTSNNHTFVPILMPSTGLSTYQQAREAVRYLSEAGLAIDAFHVTTNLEKLFKQWQMTQEAR